MNHISCVRFFISNGVIASQQWSFKKIRMDFMSLEQNQDNFISKSFTSENYINGKVSKKLYKTDQAMKFFTLFYSTLQETLKLNNIEVVKVFGSDCFIIRYEVDQLPISRIFNEIRERTIKKMTKGIDCKIYNTPTLLIKENELKDYYLPFNKEDIVKIVRENEVLKIKKIARVIAQGKQDENNIFFRLPLEMCCKIISYCTNQLTEKESSSIALARISHRYCSKVEHSVAPDLLSMTREH